MRKQVCANIEQNGNDPQNFQSLFKIFNEFNQKCNIRNCNNPTSGHASTAHYMTKSVIGSLKKHKLQTNDAVDKYKSKEQRAMTKE